MKPLKIIFITLVAINDINDRNLYADLMRYFVKQGHHVTIISPAERRTGIQTNLKKEGSVNILRIKCPNIQKANIFEKAVGTFIIDYLIKSAVKKYLNEFEFNLAIYSTPPITLVKTIQYLRGKHFLKTYLLLKDIFPQNAIDLGLMKKGSLFYRYFRNKEEELYRLSDKIGCMSQANVDYVVRQNPQVDIKKVEICPNSVEIQPLSNTTQDPESIRRALGIVDGQRVFIYGGNLGKPQGIDFLIDVLSTQIDNERAFFIIIGSGTEYGKLEKWHNSKKPKNVIVRSYLPKVEYDSIVNISDVGMIFLNYKFKIPNYPSRLLSYLEMKKPVLAVTDDNSDIGTNAEIRNYGKWSPSNRIDLVNKQIDFFCEASEQEIKEMGKTGYYFLKENYTTKTTYNIIIDSLRVDL